MTTGPLNLPDEFAQKVAVKITATLADMLPEYIAGDPEILKQHVTCVRIEDGEQWLFQGQPLFSVIYGDRGMQIVRHR